MHVCLRSSGGIGRRWSRSGLLRRALSGTIGTFARAGLHFCGAIARHGDCRVKYECSSKKPDWIRKTILGDGEWLPGDWMVEGSVSDPWLGSVHRFPAVLHARASFSFDVNSESLQKALVAALSSLLRVSMPREITIADRAGYSKSRVLFKIGVGNGDGFDIFDRKEEERVLGRIESLGPFNFLDLAFDLHYAVEDGRKHKVHGDYYLVRMVFQPGRVELLVHHGKGVRRIEPDEMVGLIVRELNSQLDQRGFSELELETIKST